MYLFPIELTPDDNGTLLVTCPLLPEVTTFGENKVDALARARDAIEEAMAARVSRWVEDVPIADRDDLLPAFEGGNVVKVSSLAAIKTLLYHVCRDAGVTRAELARRLGWHREQVDRLFRFDHASRLDQLDEALGAVGRRLDFTTQAA